MWYMPAQDPRQRLLDRVLDHIADHGAADLSLRQLAAAVGTCHRMLIHHFGSKEGLLIAVVKEVEQQQRDALSELMASAPDASAAGWQFWERLSDPSLHRQARLFFELYGQALQGRPWAAALLDGIVDDWIRPLAALLQGRGADPDEAAVDARLATAVARGLLLDLLATGDREAVDAAMARFAALHAAAARAGKAKGASGVRT